MTNKPQNTKTSGQPDNLNVIPEQEHPTRKTRVMNKLSLLALLLIACSLAVILRWSFADTNVLEIKNSPFPANIVTDATKQTGGVVLLNADYCKNKDLTGEVRISYVSKSREVFLPLTQDTMETGCNNAVVPVIIPLNLPKDDYIIKFRVTYKLNPLKQNIFILFESRPVTVGAEEAL